MVVCAAKSKVMVSAGKSESECRGRIDGGTLKVEQICIFGCCDR